MKIKPKIKTNKLDHNPLFIKILNWQGDRYTIETLLAELLKKFDSEKDRSAVSAKLLNLSDESLNLLSDFQKRFKHYILESINNKSPSEEFLVWLSNAFKYIEERIDTYINDETRTVTIKDENGRWLEGLICYNYIMTFNYFGLENIKLCPICKKYFAHKGKYAKYCSDGCKETGMKK